MTTNKPDPLDETDHRDRLDRDGDRWKWQPIIRRGYKGHWSIGLTEGSQKLSVIQSGCGPLRFADEETS